MTPPKIWNPTGLELETFFTRIRWGTIRHFWPAGRRNPII